MVTKLIDKIIKRVILVFVFLVFFGFNLASAMESATSMKDSRDTGIIGERKTIQGEKVYYEESTGITYHVRKRGTFVTPQVIDDIAYFGSYQQGYPTSLGYSFRLSCLNWKYSIVAYWSSPDVTKERVGFSVDLESPDKKTAIYIKEVDIPVSGVLATFPNQKQLDALQLKTYVEDPFLGDERILAAQQAIRWILDRERDNHEARDSSISFTSEQIGNYVFVKTEADIFSKKENVIKKCVIWALNFRGARLKKNESIRWMETWICRVISDPSNYSSAMAQARTIIETFKFDSGRNVYPDLKPR